MRVFGAALFAFIASGNAVLAQECSPTTEAQGAELRAEFRALSNKARQLKARSGSQALSLADLGDQDRGAIPDLPAAPSLTDGLFTETGAPIWTCDGDGAPDPTVAALQEVLAAYRGDLAEFEAALASRDTAILAAGQGDGAVASDASPDGQPDGTGDGAGDTSPPPDDTAPGSVAEGGGQTAPEAASPGQDGATATAPRAEPLRDPDNPNLFRRIISLPDTTIRNDPDATIAATEVPTFSVMYVFDETSANGVDWLKVSQSLLSDEQGWVERDKTLDWSSMLVMKFAPKGQRGDVLFFANDTELTDIVNSFTYQAEAQQIYEGISAERARLRDAPQARPEWDRRLVAIEPQAAVTFENQPYLLPILDWREELFDGTIETTLLKVAAVPADAATVKVDDRDNRGIDMDAAAENDGIFRVGIVFVIDTTISMSPFIDRTYETIQSFYDSFQEFETTSFVSFGLTGFRDSMTGPEGQEYTTRQFQPLDVDARPEAVLTNMRQAREAAVPTIGFKEDVFAGVIEAVEFNDWSPFDARVIVLITDASARSGDDPMSKYVGNTAQSVAELARGRNIAIVPVHLVTPANRSNGDAAIAETQYSALAETGDVNNRKYIALDATDDAVFAQEVQNFTRSVAQQVLAANSGIAPSVETGDVELEEVPAPSLAGAVANEIFRAQLESLAVAADGSAPNFLAGWTADRDLRDPNQTTLEVSVFLTRNQLSSLDKQLGGILDAFQRGGDDPSAFFENLQSLAAQTATDPDIVRNDDRAAMRAILPSFLQNLPYKSEVLQLDRELWNSLSVANRSEFIDKLVAKRKIYENVFNTTELWQDFGTQDPSLQVTPVRLSALP